MARDDLFATPAESKPRASATPESSRHQPLAELLWRLAGWPDAVPVNLILSVLLAVLVSVAYWQTLGPLGRLLQRRETKILGVVTVEVE